MQNMAESESKTRDDTTMSCRICHSVSKDILLAPCFCKGTMRYVHQKCLELWLNESVRTNCELCSFEFTVNQTRRYSFLESLPVWFRRPGVQLNCQLDVLSIVILTLMTVALAIICYFSVRSIVEQDSFEGALIEWTAIFMIVVGLFAILFYAGAIYFILHNFITPWLRWWRTCVDIKLVKDQFKECELHDKLFCLKDNSSLVEDLKHHNLFSPGNQTIDNTRSNTTLHNKYKHSEQVIQVKRTEEEISFKVIDSDMETENWNKTVVDKSEEKLNIAV